MIALITGASSGIGRDMARELSKRGYDLILVARRKDRLVELKKELQTIVKIYECDLAKEENCKKLYEDLKDENIDILINNAGFGLAGEFTKTDLDKELIMIDVNVKAIQILTKYFLKDFTNKNNGYILNVSSSAGLLPGGPLMDTYYATKSYICNLTLGIYEELRSNRSNVYIGVLCPGPVSTEFDKVANVQFSLHSLSSEYVAKYAIKKMLKRKTIIIPGFKIRIACFFGKFISRKTLLKFVRNTQQRKNNR